MRLLTLGLICFCILISERNALAVDDKAECVKKCDAKYPTGLPITFCGIDGISYQTTSGAILQGTESCYIACGVTAQYEGPCGCPNECQADVYQGECSINNNGCICNQGWGGLDCSLPILGNKCSYHGRLIEKGSKNNKFPFDYCECDSGWVGTDCSTQKLAIGNAPWGTIYDDVTPYTDEDQYGDNHPLFDIERLPTIRIDIPDAAYIELINPENLFNSTYTPVTVYWDNGKDQITLTNVGMKLKGQGSLECQKKGFALKFNEFISGQKLYDMKKIGLKPGYDADDVFIKNILYSNFIRSTGIPSPRIAYTLLYLNQQFYGLMMIVEDINSDFLTRRLADDDGSGTMFKLYAHVHLNYVNNETSYYQSQVKTTDLNTTLAYYNPEEDTQESWNNLIDFLYFFNITSNNNPNPTTFHDQAETMLDIRSLLRIMVIESFMLADDQFEEGNNYYLYRQAAKKKDHQWLLFYYDFDDSFFFNPVDSHTPDDEDADVIEFFASKNSQFTDYSFYNPILDGIFQDDQYRQEYLSNYCFFVTTIFGTKSEQQPSYRYNQLFQFVHTWIAKDKMWQMTNGATPSDFEMEAYWTIDQLNWRFQNVMGQLSNCTGITIAGATKLP